MIRQTALALGLVCLGGLFSSCVTQEKPVAQAQAFGQPESTIPWNQPQSWEGNAGGLNALRGNEGR